tara:strand:+ start:912 stop:2057 length:1146 start_codon:yes stop_codon:yes gene_type:complete
MDNENNNSTGDLENNTENNTPETNENVQDNNVDTSSQDFQNMLDSVFNQNNLIFVGWFVGVYLVVYLGLGIFYKKKGEESSFKKNAKKIVDFLFVILLVFMLITFFYLLSKDEQNQYTEDIYNTVTSYLDNPYSLLPVIAILIAFYVVLYLFRIPLDENKPFSVSFIEGSLWITLVIIVLVQFFKQVFNLSLLDFVNEIQQTNTEVEESNEEETPEAPVVSENEVFHVGNNKYTYDDAKAICKSYNADLATYQQVENSYKNGGEWCGYGWSQDQMALFPTQQSTYDKLKENGPEVQHNCGRPGVNGGYMTNPYIKFGVNCFGKKPDATSNDMARMTATEDALPQTAEQKELQAKINYWKENASELLQLSSFNKQKWSKNDN